MKIEQVFVGVEMLHMKQKQKITLGSAHLQKQKYFIIFTIFDQTHRSRKTSFSNCPTF